MSEYFPIIYEHISDVVVLYHYGQNGQLLIVNANDAFFNETGFNKEKVLNHPIEEVFKKKISDNVYRLLNQLNTDNPEVSFQTMINVPSGELFWKIHFQAIFNDDQSIRFIISKSVNVSEKKELLNMISRLRVISSVGKIGGWEFYSTEKKVFWTEEMFHIHEVDYSFSPTIESMYQYYEKEDVDLIFAQYKVLYDIACDKFGDTSDDSSDSRYKILDDQAEMILAFKTTKQKQLWVRIVAKIAFLNKEKYKYFGVLQDLTEQIQLEKQLEFEKKKLKNILETQNDLICRSYPDTTIIYVNEAYANYFNSTTEKLIGTKFLLSIPPENHEYLLDSFKKLNWKNQMIETEHPVYSGDGSIRWMQWTDYGIFNEFGDLIELQSNGRDITEKKQLEMALKHREMLYKSLLDTSPFTILLINDHANISFANHHASDLFEIDEHKIAESSICKWVNHDEKSIMKMLKRVVRQDKVYKFEIQIYTAKKKIKYCEVFITPMKMEDKNQLFLITISDISDRKEMGKHKAEIERLTNQTVRLSSISALSAGITHEINQPLNAMKIIIEGLQFLKERDIHKYFSSLEDKMSFFSEQILRIENIIKSIRSMIYDNPDFIASSFNVHERTLKIIEMFRKDITDYQINIDYKTSLEHQLIKNYPIQFEQIMINILSNFIHVLIDEDEIRHKRINIFIGMRVDKLILKLSNNGPHLQQEELDRLFEPFYSNKKNKKGTGLGLAICYQLISSLGGSIHAENIDPHGVLFTVILPNGV